MALEAPKETRHSNDDVGRGKFNQGIKAYSDTFFNYSAATAGTPIQLIDPEFNHNGIELLDINVGEYIAAGGPPFYVILANRSKPQNINDGDAIHAPSQITAAGAGATMDNAIYLEKGKGLWLWPVTASTGVRQGTYRKI